MNAVLYGYCLLCGAPDYDGYPLVICGQLDYAGEAIGGCGAQGYICEACVDKRSPEWEAAANRWRAAHSCEFSGVGAPDAADLAEAERDRLRVRVEELEKALAGLLDRITFEPTMGGHLRNVRLLLDHGDSRQTSDAIRAAKAALVAAPMGGS